MLELLVSLKWPLIVLQIIIAPLLVLFVLLQTSRGDDLGSALSGGGGSSSVLGTGGASKLLVKGTAILCALFLLNSLVLAKIFKESSLATVGGSQEEPLAPANALDPVMPNAVAPVPTPAPATNSVTPAAPK